MQKLNTKDTFVVNDIGDVVELSERGDEKDVTVFSRAVCSMLWSAITIVISNCVMGADYEKNLRN